MIETSLATQITKDNDTASGDHFDPNYTIQMYIILGVALFFCILSLIFYFCWKREKNKAQLASNTSNISQDLEEPLSGNNEHEIEMMMNQVVDLQIIDDDEDVTKGMNTLEIDDIAVSTDILSSPESDGMYNNTKGNFISKATPIDEDDDTGNYDGLYRQENRVTTIEGAPPTNGNTL